MTALRSAVGARPPGPDAAGGLLPDGTAETLAAELRALAASITAASPVEPRLLSAAIPTVRVDPVGAFATALAAGRPATLWLQPQGARAWVGIGAAVTLEIEGPGRFAAAGEAWRAWRAGALIGGPAHGLPAAGPVLLGGGTFADTASRDPRWAGLETGRLVVPAILLGLDGDRSALTASLVVHDVADAEGAIQSLVRAVRLLEQSAAPLTPGARSASLKVAARVPDLAAWSTGVARSAGAVGRGRLDKVVLARRVDLEADAELDPSTILRRLEDTAPASTIFAIGGPGRATFLGATPERLVEARGRAFRTVALAGTIGRGTDDAADEQLAAALLGSEKDREEHAVVVGMLRETLEPLTERLEIASRPHVVRLRTVQHLATEVAGTLRPDATLLELVEALHPTPAVGGWPTELALELIAEQEGIDRGWYAGPVGWLDADGDGEFVVAIRSGLVDGRRASLFAGCGIVADSEPDREWEESELKLRALGAALGRIEP